MSETNVYRENKQYLNGIFSSSVLGTRFVSLTSAQQDNAIMISSH